MQNIHDAALRMREEMVKRERKAVSNYISSSECQFFSQVEHPVTTIAEGEIDMILAAGVTLENTLFHLRNLSLQGFKCRGLVELAMEVQVAYVNLIKHKRLVHEFITSPNCKLFTFPINRSAAGMNGSPVTLFVTLADAGTFVDDCGTGDLTLGYMLALEEQHRRFDSLPHIVTAVTELHVAEQKANFFPNSLRNNDNQRNVEGGSQFYRSGYLARAAESLNSTKSNMQQARYQILLSYLSSASCRLFNNRAQIQVSEKDANELIDEFGSVPAAIQALRVMDVQNRRFVTFVELLWAARAEPTRYAPGNTSATSSNSSWTSKERGTVLSFLRSEENRLFETATVNIRVRTSDLDELLRVGGGVEQTLSLLRQLNELNRSFSLFSDLLLAVEAGVVHIRTASLNRFSPSGFHAKMKASALSPVSPEDRNKLLQFLASPQISRCFAEDSDIQITTAHLDKMLREGGGGVNPSLSQTLKALKRLCTPGAGLSKERARYFHSMEELTEELVKARVQATTPVFNTVDMHPAPNKYVSAAVLDKSAFKAFVDERQDQAREKGMLKV